MCANRTEVSFDNGAIAGSSSSSDGDSTDTRRKRSASKSNGKKRSASQVDTNGVSDSFSNRRHSLSKAARDPRDQPSFKKRAVGDGQNQIVRQPSPVIAADGLSRACKFS